MSARDEPSNLFTGADEPPTIYIATPLTGLPREERNQLDAWCKNVEDALLREANNAGAPWEPALHTALRHTAPWKDDEFEPEDIYKLNSDRLWAKADALIVFSHRGGSLGAGMELAWAAATGIPVLVLVAKGETASRQVTGAREEMDITVVEFASAAQLQDEACRWLTAKRAVIEANPFRRALRQQRALRLMTAVAVRWTAASPERRVEVEAVAGRPASRIVRLASDIDAILTAPIGELMDVTAALGIDVGVETAAATATLDLGQLRGLQQAAKEYEWSADTVVELVVRAQAELVSGGVRRLPLSSIEDWVAFKKARLG